MRSSKVIQDLDRHIVDIHKAANKAQKALSRFKMQKKSDVGHLLWNIIDSAAAVRRRVHNVASTKKTEV